MDVEGKHMTDGRMGIPVGWQGAFDVIKLLDASLTRPDSEGRTIHTRTWGKIRIHERGVFWCVERIMNRYLPKNADDERFPSGKLDYTMADVKDEIAEGWTNTIDEAVSAVAEAYEQYKEQNDENKEAL